MAALLTAIGYVIASTAWLIAAIAFLILAKPLRKALTAYSVRDTAKRVGLLVKATKEIAARELSDAESSEPPTR